MIGLERTADLMSALLGVEVSTEFISSCLARLDACPVPFELIPARGADQRGSDVAA